MDKILIGCIATLIGILGAFAVGRYNALRNESKQFFDKFLDLINLFSNQDITEGLYDHLINNFNTHKTAVINFRRHLTWYQRIGFDKAWNNYRYERNKAYPPPDIELEIPLLVQYSEGLRWDTENTKKLILNRIHKLTSYSKPK